MSSEEPVATAEKSPIGGNGTVEKDGQDSNVAHTELPEFDPTSRLDEYEKLFKNRYTDEDPEYAKSASLETMEPVMIQPWPPVTSNEFVPRSRNFNRYGQNQRGGRYQQRWQNDGRRNDNNYGQQQQRYGSHYNNNDGGGGGSYGSHYNEGGRGGDSRRDDRRYDRHDDRKGDRGDRDREGGGDGNSERIRDY